MDEKQFERLMKEKCAARAAARAVFWRFSVKNPPVLLGEDKKLLEHFNHKKVTVLLKLIQIDLQYLKGSPSSLSMRFRPPKSPKMQESKK